MATPNLKVIQQIKRTWTELRQNWKKSVGRLPLSSYSVAFLTQPFWLWAFALLKNGLG
jgi:hypothetical protein